MPRRQGRPSHSSGKNGHLNRCTKKADLPTALQSLVDLYGDEAVKLELRGITTRKIIKRRGGRPTGPMIDDRPALRDAASKWRAKPSGAVWRLSPTSRHHCRRGGDEHPPAIGSPSRADHALDFCRIRQARRGGHLRIFAWRPRAADGTRSRRSRAPARRHPYRIVHPSQRRGDPRCGRPYRRKGRR